MSDIDAVDKTIDALSKNANRDFYADCIANFPIADSRIENIPMSPIYLDNVNEEHVVVLTEEVLEKLRRIQNVTSTSNGEVSYFLFGRETKAGSIIFDNVVSTFEPTASGVADFGNINQNLRDFMKQIREIGPENLDEKRVVCHGHSHPNIGGYADNFSLADLSAYYQMTELHPFFKNRQVETMGMLLNPSGDFNCVMYENSPSYEGFYKFPEVYVMGKDRHLEQLPAYQNGNYIDKNTIR